MAEIFNQHEFDFRVKALIDDFHARCRHRHDFDSMRRSFMDGAELVLALSRDFERNGSIDAMGGEE